MKTFLVAKLNSNTVKFSQKCARPEISFFTLILLISATLVVVVRSQLFKQHESSNRLRPGGIGGAGGPPHRYFAANQPGGGGVKSPHPVGGFPGRRSNKVRGGPFNLVGGGGGGPFSAGGDYLDGAGGDDEEDSYGIEDTSLRRKKIVMFDIFNLYQPFVTLIKALAQLFSRLWTRLQTFQMSLLSGGADPAEGAQDGRLSTIIVSWVVLATFSMLIALCIKRLCSNLNNLREIPELDPSNGDEGEEAEAVKDLNNIAQKNTNTSTTTASKNIKKNKNGSSLRKRKPSTKRSKEQGDGLRSQRALVKTREPLLFPCLEELPGFEARWVDLILKNLLNRSEVWSRVREVWIQALNTHTKRLAEKVIIESLRSKKSY